MRNYNRTAHTHTANRMRQKTTQDRRGEDRGAHWVGSGAETRNKMKIKYKITAAKTETGQSGTGGERRQCQAREARIYQL